MHHLTAYSRGGSTSVDNGALLCGTHHRHVHAHHLTATRTSHGAFTWHSTAPQNPALPSPASDAAIHALARRWRRRQHQAASTASPELDEPEGRRMTAGGE